MHRIRAVSSTPQHVMEGTSMENSTDKVILWGFSPRDGKREFGLVSWHYKTQATSEPPLLLLESQLAFGGPNEPARDCTFGYAGKRAEKRWPDEHTEVIFRQVDISLFRHYATAILPPSLEVKFETLHAIKLAAGLVQPVRVGRCSSPLYGPILQRALWHAMSQI